jgi:cytochrome oxidase Cu insertion factor (SCO1/SenC/PrrC family)
MIETHDQPLRGRRPLRFALLVLAGAAVLGGTVGVLLHLAFGTGTTQAAPTAPVLEGQAVWAAGRNAAPDFTLRDQWGRQLSLSGQRRRTVVLAFMDSRCHQVCPLEGRVLARAIKMLPPATRPTLLVVSVDPWADTRSSAFAAGVHWGFTGSWHWLFGTHAQLARVWRAYRIYVKRTTADVVHSDAIYVIDQRGFERVGFLYPFLPGPLQRDLVQLAAESRA